MTEEEIDVFEKVQAQLEGLHSEIGALSKKSQNDALNKFKLKFVNQVLNEANKILGEPYKPFAEFDLFSEDDMPTNSDVTMIVSQYLSCMEKLRVDNIYSRDLSVKGRVYKTQWFWKDIKQETYAPIKIK